MAVKKNKMIAQKLSEKSKLVTVGACVANGIEGKPENQLRQEIYRNCHGDLYDVSFSKTVFSKMDLCFTQSLFRCIFPGMATYKSSHQIYKKAVFKNLAILIGKLLCYSLFLIEFQT